MDRFQDVPVEDDTAILFSLQCKLGEMDILYQKWLWDGITAESFIFVSDDVVKLTDAALEKEVRTSPAVKSDSSITIKRSDSGFTFVNFNFVTDEDDDSEPEVLTADELKQKRMKTLSYIGKANSDAVKNIKKSRAS